MIKDIDVITNTKTSKRFLPSKALVVECTFFTVLGFLLARAGFFGMLNTFGIAWIISAFLTSRVPVFAAIGAIAGYASIIGGTSDLQQFITSTGIIAGEYMILFSAKKLYKHIGNILYIIVGTAFYTISVSVVLFSEGFTVNKLLFVILNSATLALASYAFEYVIKTGTKTAYPSASKPDMLLMLLVIVLALSGIGDVAIYSVSIRTVVAYFIIFSVSYLYGAGAGAFTGVLAGFAVSTSQGVIFSLSPLIPFAVCGIIPGLSRGIPKLLSGGLALLIYAGLFFFMQEEYSDLHYIIEVSAGVLAYSFIPFDAVAVLRESVISVNSAPAMTKTYAERVRSVCSEKISSVKDTSENMHNILSDYLNRTDESLIADFSDLEKIIAETVCSHCTLDGSCTFTNKKGKHDPDCRVAHLINKINYVSNTWRSRMAMYRRIPTIAVGCLNESISDVKDSIDSTVKIDTLMTVQVGQALARASRLVSNAVVSKGESGFEVTVELKTLSVTPFEASRIKSACEETLNTKLDPVSTDGEVITFSERAKYMLATGFASISFDPDGICGDASAVMRYGNNGFLLAVADGCGTGYPALRESNMVMELLDVLAGTGCKEQSMLSLINLLMGLRMNDESYSTADICVFNKFNGNAKFMKMGAVCSFIIHNGSTSVVSCGASPLGVTDEGNECTHNCKLKSDDVIVMMTDGVYDSTAGYRDPNEYFADMFKEIKFRNPQEAANEILDRAAGNLKRIKDDMLVAVAIVKKAG